MTETAIGWTDQVWNPVTGCSKVSEGCRNCYAEVISLRYGRSKHPWSAQFAAENVVLHPDRLTAPLKWKKPARCFVNSMSDLFHELVPDEYIDQIFAVMALTPRHTYQVLTKRPERMATYVAKLQGQLERLIGASRTLGYSLEFERNHLFDWPLPNIWLGTSVENQAAADERIPHLLRAPAAVRFLSCEPLLGPVDLHTVHYGEHALDVLKYRYRPWETRQGWHDTYMSFGLAALGKVHWVIVGGESGPKHRPMDLDWTRSLIEQCTEAGVKVYTKQDSGMYPGRQGRIPDALWRHEFPASPAARQAVLL